MGSIAHRAMTLMLYTGAARSDVVRLGRGSIRDGRLVYRRRKTQRNPDGIEVSIPIHPYLAETLSHVRADAFTFLETPNRTTRTPEGLGTAMRKWCDRAGLPKCSSHGRRKAICRRIAEIEGDPFKVMAIYGHKDILEAQKYCDRYNRNRKADSAIASLPTGANQEHPVVNFPGNRCEPAANPMKNKESRR